MTAADRAVLSKAIAKPTTPVLYKVQERDVPVTGDERERILLDLVAGRTPTASSPAAQDLLERLQKDLAAMPKGAIVEIPHDLP